MSSDSGSISVTSAQDASEVVSNMSASGDPASDNEPAQTTRSLETLTQDTSNDTVGTENALYELFVPNNPAHNKDLKTLRGGRAPLSPLPDRKGQFSLNDYLLRKKVILARFDYEFLL
ncbi:hypothetical protein DFQ27_000246, partial [Actinomortierella ambigua]